jgi:hypothetical protein
MGATDVLNRKTGVIWGDDVLSLFKHAREHKYAIPAIVSPDLVNNSLSGLSPLTGNCL